MNAGQFNLSDQLRGSEGEVNMSKPSDRRSKQLFVQLEGDQPRCRQSSSPCGGRSKDATDAPVSVAHVSPQLRGVMYKIAVLAELSGSDIDAGCCGARKATRDPPSESPVLPISKFAINIVADDLSRAKGDMYSVNR
jgi:hypothetical protein